MDPDLLENVLNISRHMAQIRNLTPLLDYVVDEAMRLVGAEQGFVVLVEPDGSLDFRVKRSVDGTEIPDAEFQISKSVLNKSLETGEPQLLYDAMNSPNFGSAASVMSLKLRSIMCVPLTSHGKNIGAIYVENREMKARFDKKDLPPLIIFANQAAVSIENAALNDGLEKRVADRTEALQDALGQLEESWAQEMEANRIRKEWLNNVTHDLRTPLSIASGWLMLLQSNPANELTKQQHEWINNALDAVHNTTELINDLFDLSKLEVGGLSLYPEAVDTHDFLTGIYDVGQGLSWAGGVTLELDIPQELPTLWIDPLRIRQVVTNLLSNANKFTKKGSVTIHARYLEDSDEVLIGVADTGTGIPPNKLETLFNRFEQAEDEDLERRRRGTGLGLAICRSLVEMHDGRIWIESTLGEGSDFKFTLPVTEAPDEASSQSFNEDDWR
jgi:signal transduction histidine kinase